MKLILLLLLLPFTFEKTSDFNLINSIPVTASFITTDKLGNVYTLSNNELSKYSSKGELIKTFSNKNYGEISFVDVSNPMKIMLFYNDFKQLIFLDNTLSITGSPISLYNYNLQGAKLACMSHSSGIWFYDEKTIQLIRYDQNFNINNQSGNIVNTTNYEINPNFLIEDNNWVYLNNPETGILVFDIYGTFYKTIPVKNLLSFQIFDDILIYKSKGKFITYNLKTLEEKTINLPKDGVEFLRIEKDMFYLTDKQTLYFYQLK